MYWEVGDGETYHRLIQQSLPLEFDGNVARRQDAINANLVDMEILRKSASLKV